MLHIVFETVLTNNYLLFKIEKYYDTLAISQETVSQHIWLSLYLWNFFTNKQTHKELWHSSISHLEGLPEVCAHLLALAVGHRRPGLSPSWGRGQPAPWCCPVWCMRTRSTGRIQWRWHMLLMLSGVGPCWLRKRNKLLWYSSFSTQVTNKELTKLNEPMTAYFSKSPSCERLVNI